jgi:hypothetical protein
MLRSVFLFLCAAASYAATPFFQVSFDQVGRDWSVVRGLAAPDAAAGRPSGKSLRLEAGAGSTDACVRSAPVSLTIGKRYELSGWIRTENLTVRDLGRSPIASGAALTMASMPFDVHSASVAGTHSWTRVSLRFVASRAKDAILLFAGNGGALGGKAWFEEVSIDEASSADEWPAAQAVQTFGPAYRFPAAGWIYLHIEGKPYDRGYQHGYLMAREIPEYLKRCAFEITGKSDVSSWEMLRTSANALFLRGFDREILEEMRGIADGANANSAKWLDRKIDLIDLVVANTAVEMGELRSAMATTPTGLEGLDFAQPPYAPAKKSPSREHCSAFVATGPATRDGKMIIGHITMWPLTLAEQTNVMLDIKPETGHRLLMQSYPGGIESGTDWYQNDAGVVLTETTIDQSPFDIEGTPVAFRARRAIQYGGNIDEVVRELGTRNNGLYTNEWLIGDAKNDEIAMYELGTHHTKLWRSSKNEWFGDTPGFYWGDNNAKDLSINLEYQPDPKGAPSYIPYWPGPRDLAWQDLYRKYKGQIDEQFGFLAFRTPPLVTMTTIDSKIATSDMANRLMVWAEMGRPNESVWAATPGDPGPNHGLYPGGYHLFRAEPSDAVRRAIDGNEKERAAAKHSEKPEENRKTAQYEDRLWKGWVLPASDADTWLVAGSARYYRVLESDDPERALDALRVQYRGVKLSPDNPLNRHRIEEAKGALFLDSLRRKMGDDAFLKLMSDYFSVNTTKTVTAQSFLDKAGVPFDFKEPADGPAYIPGDIWRRLGSVAVVYGTVAEAGVNRYTAEQFQIRARESGQTEVVVLKDFEASDDQLAHQEVVFVGRPETNSALAGWTEKIGLSYSGAVFGVDGKAYASERNSLVYAAKNPLDPSHMVLVLAGNDPLRTAESLNGGFGQLPAVVMEDGMPLDGGSAPRRK